MTDIYDILHEGREKFLKRKLEEKAEVLAARVEELEGELKTAYADMDEVCDSLLSHIDELEGKLKRAYEDSNRD